MTALPLCGATTRSGRPCANAAGKKTDHRGVGRCYLHGGASPIRNPGALKTTELARYRVGNNAELGELIARFEADPNPLNVLTEVAVLRAVLHQALERMQSRVCPLCERPPDEDRIPGLVEGVSRVIGRIEKARSQQSVAVVELVNFVNRLAIVVKHHVADPETLKAIAAEWHDVGVSITATRGG